jgi:AcrR family transcriptional regulator
MSTRAKLLETALAVFAERGADGGSMREIARRAGLNVATAYHHFGSKRELLLSIFKELGFVDTPLDLSGWDPAANGQSAEEVLELIMLGAWTSMSTGADVLKLAITEALKGDEDVRAVFDEWQRQGDRFLEELVVQTGLADPTTAADRALALRHVIWGRFVSALMSDELDAEHGIRHARAAALALASAWC